MGSEAVAQVYARYVAGLRYEDLPAEVVAKAKECILDQLGVEVRGASLPWVQPAYQMAQDMGGKKESTIVYYGDRISAPYAAYVNATFGQSCELDDVVVPAAVHGGVATVPAALAVGEKVGATGKDFIVSVVAGYEIVGRVAEATFGGLQARGFHAQTVSGVFGATAAAGKLLGLNEEQMAHAFGIAGSHAGGTVEYDQSGGEVKRVHAGIAVRGGVQAALLAQRGLTGPATIFEGKRGILHTFADSDAVGLLTDGLGEQFKIFETLVKIYPTVGVHIGPLEVLSGMLKANPIDHRQVRSVRVGVVEHGVLHGGGAIYHPHDVISAQFSLPFSIALRLVKGNNSLTSYMDPKLWVDGDILRVADAVTVYGLPEAKGLKQRASKVEITLADGRKQEGYEEFPKGSPQNPLSRGELEAKF
ncbi:MAG: MmgE/PrpD family protein, partial [Chloroflexi bacterium]|nr:MmgE/PrpD family protein [Chloroflexota bacterium]